MQYEFDFFGIPMPGPNSLKLWLGCGEDFHELINNTEDVLDYYRRLYAVEYGIVHSLREVSVKSANSENEGRYSLSFEVHVLFFKTRKELKKYEMSNF